MGKGPPPLEIHEETFTALISGHIPSEEGEVSSEPVKAGRGWHILMFRLTRTFDSLGKNPTNSNSHLPQLTRPIELALHPRISTFAVSYVPLLDIHKVFAVPRVGSTGRYKNQLEVNPAGEAFTPLINTYIRNKEKKEEVKGRQQVQTYPKATWSALQALSLQRMQVPRKIHKYENHNHTSHQHRLQAY
ncbi:hypothetical protein J6590_102049 [Homalodisca vitripennis]|nr:hypothetical protein J6590_102049 [Homalodisca vitripennis]